MAKIIGIDLGTTNSAVAVMEGGEPRILENAEGNRTTPSIAALSKANERLVGLLAKRQAITNPKNTIFSVKRLIGRKFNDPEVQRDKAWLPYDIRSSASGGVEVKMGEEWYSPEQISAFILGKLKADAEAKLGEKIEEAVITVPAYFDDSQRQATKNAGEIAGLKVNRIVNEPTAAALAYGLNKQKSEKIVVYDFGGGTFDISVLEVGDDTVEVKSTGGDTHLGGDDFDKEIQQYLAEEYKKQEGIDISKDPLAVQRLKEAAERAKHELSSAAETEINIPYISSDANGPKHFLMKMTRAKLEDLVGKYIQRSIELTNEAVTAPVPKGAGFKIGDINEVVLVGGQTRMPAIQEAVKKLFGKDPHQGINPDEVVAIGAGVQGGILQGDVKDILLLDVTPLTLSIETMGAVATPMIPKNTTVPTSKTQTFSTAADNQTSVEVHVLQGERPMAADNKTLALFRLDGIPPSPRGVPQIEVSFDIDANGILSVKAADKASGKSQSVKIEASTSLSKEEIERLKQEAAKFAEEDAQKKELVEARNQAETMVYTAEKSLRDAGDKVPADVKTAIEEKIKAIAAVKDGSDKAAIEKAIGELSAEMQKIGEAYYNKDQAAQEPNGTDNQNTEPGAEPAAGPDTRLPEAHRLPAFWKLVIFDALSVLSAAAVGYGCLLYFSGAVNFILFASVAALFLTMSFFGYLFAMDRKHRLVSSALQIFAFLIFFYSVKISALLSAMVILAAFYLLAHHSAHSISDNSIRFKFGSVARAYMKKIFIGFALAAIVLYLPQWNSNNVFVPQPKFQQWYDGFASLSQKFYIGVDLTASVGKFAEGIVSAQLSTNSQFRAFPLNQQNDVLQKGVQELMANMSKNLGFKLTSDMPLSESFYRYLLNLFTNFKNQFGNSFLAVWAVVLFVIVWSTGTLVMGVVVIAAYLLFELFSAFNIVHIAGETRTKEIVQLS